MEIHKLKQRVKFQPRVYSAIKRTLKNKQLAPCVQKLFSVKFDSTGSLNMSASLLRFLHAVCFSQEFIFPLFFVMYSYSGFCIFNI